jgi:small-conductance mechanosensitive channel
MPTPQLAELEREVEQRSAVFKKELGLFDLVLTQVGAITLVLGLASLIGVRTQEAFQLLDNAGGVFYAITYLVLFAIPLIGLKRFGVRAPLWLRLACASGFVVTVIYIGFTIVPIITVESRITFASKIIGAVLIANGIGLAIFLLAAKRARHQSGLPATPAAD